jgi:hypothetical protein
MSFQILLPMTFLQLVSRGYHHALATQLIRICLMVQFFRLIITLYGWSYRYMDVLLFSSAENEPACADT